MMQVLDFARSERGQQRKKTPDGRLLHCCCVCGKIAPWGKSWSWFGSEKELDDGADLAKFCSARCSEKAGTDANNITSEMRVKACEAELREPILAYRQATDREKYGAAAARQRELRQP